MFDNPEFCILRGTERDYGDPEAMRVNDVTGQKLFHVNSGAYELGFDFAQVRGAPDVCLGWSAGATSRMLSYYCGARAQPFAFSNHSTGMIFVRPLDIPDRDRGRREFTLPVAFVPGPSEPANIDVYLAPIAKEFQEYGPDGAVLHPYHVPVPAPAPALVHR